jgi:UDP-N-acetylglucosamine--N-acetylmuramyl-(pentapeptide) pyrophosphoryl-undecaprenol N-acetylglucosamine transferase
MSRGPILVMAGGTGGHVFPGLAVARALRDAGVPVAWLGTRRGLEARLVPAAGIRISYISVGGLRGKGWMTRVLAPFRLAWALVQSLAVMLRTRPRTVLGMGGFVTGPAGLAAWLTRRRLVIHEQNAIAGLTNRILARFADQVLEAFPGSFSDRDGVVAVGNPVRPEIAALRDPAQRLGGRTGRPRLLIFGGSQGAMRLNEIVPAALTTLPEEIRPEIIHQTGERTLETARESYRATGVAADIRPFIDDMAAAYEWADLAICRAGALTVTELAAAGLGAVLIPFPAAVDDHQTRNAEFLVRAGAARIIKESELSPAGLAEVLRPMLADPEERRRMALAARSVARPDALERIVRICLQAREENDRG